METVIFDILDKAFHESSVLWARCSLEAQDSNMISEIVIPITHHIQHTVPSAQPQRSPAYKSLALACNLQLQQSSFVSKVENIF